MLPNEKRNWYAYVSQNAHTDSGHVGLAISLTIFIVITIVETLADFVESYLRQKVKDDVEAASGGVVAHVDLKSVG